MFTHQKGMSMLTIKDTQISIIKRLRSNPLPNVEVDDLIVTAHAIVFLCTTYSYIPIHAASKLITKIKGFNLKNKPALMSYALSAREVKRSIAILSCDPLESDLLPVQIYVILKWE